VRLYILTLFFINLLFAQAVNWDNRARYTAMKISCDTDSVPIYLDGYYIGKTPIKQALTVTPGWHKVSIFPPDDGIPEQSVPSNKTLKDIIRLGQQDVMVEEGRVELVVMSYRAIDAEIEEYQRQTQSGTWVRASMIFALLFIIIWGL
tara:strand:+ start:92 stop:535 length:444 start_codon:yes stop_codon:yes gene_type:complete